MQYITSRKKILCEILIFSPNIMVFKTNFRPKFKVISKKKDRRLGSASDIAVPAGGQGGNCPPKFPRFGQNSNFSGSDKKIFGQSQEFQGIDIDQLQKISYQI